MNARRPRPKAHAVRGTDRRPRRSTWALPCRAVVRRAIRQAALARDGAADAGAARERGPPEP